jgi:hypothetical protein
MFNTCISVQVCWCSSGSCLHFRWKKCAYCSGYWCDWLSCISCGASSLIHSFCDISKSYMKKSLMLAEFLCSVLLTLWSNSVCPINMLSLRNSVQIPGFILLHISLNVIIFIFYWKPLHFRCMMIPSWVNMLWKFTLLKFKLNNLVSILICKGLGTSLLSTLD